MATLTISLKKITSGVKFAEQKSALLQNNNVWKKKFSVLQGNPAVASPKEQLYEQMTSNPAFTERNIPKPNASLLEFLFFSTELVRTVFGLSTLWLQQRRLWSPADICEQRERNLSFGSGARFSKVPTINVPVKLLLFTCKIEFSIVLHLSW